MKYLLLSITLVVLSFSSVAKNYYSLAGGGWSNTSYTGASGDSPPSTLPANDTIFVNVNNCTADPAGLSSCGVHAYGANCHQEAITNLNGVVYLEDDGFLSISGTVTIGNTGSVFMKDNSYLWINGSVQTGQFANTVIATLNGNSIFHWNGSITLYRKIIGNGGGIKCCGSQTVTQLPALGFYGQVFDQFSLAPNCGGGTILPVELTNFNISRSGFENDIRWTTISEIDNHYFVIERKSTHDNEFEEIAIINSSAPNGNSRNIINYQFIDEDVREDEHYFYRIKQVDFDGNYTFYYADAINSAENVEVKVFPNPVNDGEFFITNTSAHLIQKVEILNVTGVTLETYTDINEQLSFRTNLPTGSYIVKTSYNNGNAKYKKLRIL